MKTYIAAYSIRNSEIKFLEFNAEHLQEAQNVALFLITGNQDTDKKQVLANVKISLQAGSIECKFF